MRKIEAITEVGKQLNFKKEVPSGYIWNYDLIFIMNYDLELSFDKRKLTVTWKTEKKKEREGEN